LVLEEFRCWHDGGMQGGVPAYLAGVAPESVRRLADVNAAGDAALRKYLASGEAVAFLGAGRRHRCIRCGRW
jgi:hypothetical protein